MSDSEKLCLQWNEFQTIVSNAFDDLREDKDFTDVTLACEDGKQAEVHKVVLVSSSPFFKELLRRNKHPHPLIYMKGVKSENLMAMLEFFYFGEANVYQENLDTFLAFADELKLKGLNGSEQPKDNDIREQSSRSSEEGFMQDSRSSNYISEPFVKDFQKMDYKRGLKSFEGTVALNNSDSLQRLNDQINTMIVRPEKNGPKSNLKQFVCKVCGKEGPSTTIKHHIEAKHITGMSHSCDLCGKTAKTTNSLNSHKSRSHRNSK